MRNKLLIVLSASLCLSGCHTYKSYERPDIQVSDSLFRTPVNDDTSSIASLSWKELFRDGELQVLIEKGLLNNADLNIARLKVEEAEARLRSSKLYFLPSLSLTPQGSISKPEGVSSSRSYSLAATAQWEIDAFGKELSKKRGAATDVLQAEAYRQAVQTELIATIANNYFALLMLDEQKEIAVNTAESWKESVRVMECLMDAGEADIMAVNQTKANELGVEAALVNIEEQINETENALSTLVGMPAQEIRRTSLNAQVFPDELSTGIPLNILSNRPDVRYKELQLASAFYATETARASLYPNITLGGSVGWTNSATGKINNPGQWLLSALGNIVQPIFNRGANLAELKVAKTRQEEALTAFQQSLLDAGRDVNNALVQCQTAKKRIVLGEKQKETLEAALRSSEIKMQHSSENYLSVITARQTLLNAEMNIVKDRFDMIQGIISLYHALGGGIF